MGYSDVCFIAYTAGVRHPSFRGVPPGGGGGGTMATNGVRHRPNSGSLPSLGTAFLYRCDVV